MNNTVQSSGQNNIDFTQPPPGYAFPGLETPKNAESSLDFSAINKAIATYNSKREHVQVTNPRYGYYDVTNLPIYNKPRFSILSPSSRSQVSNKEPGTTIIDPRIYALPPPPPPPSEPYPGNLTIGPGQYVFNPAVYAAYSVPPPTVTGSMGSGPYVTQHPDIYPTRQFQRYPPRGGYYGSIIRKRKNPLEDSDSPKKIARKKKKPLSQNMPSRKDWSVEDARRALEVEREFNKRHKSQHLIIKFPDLELNRDIVMKFHPKIDSVHFQQPSTPRFCFVTLKDSACMDQVIRELNKIKFGDGYLTAEPKKDREEDYNIGPEDIDPLNLYVGNLAQEVTVDDVIKAYPKNKRIDIGFAKKMKYTRYAFVCFRTVDDAIEAFQNTHATEMYNKSLIVRFRRLHGTVGLPGEPKPQNPQKRNEIRNSLSESTENLNDTDATKDNSSSYSASNYQLQLKERELFSFSYGSDDEEEEEELHYSNDIRNIIANSLGTDVIANIKSEPFDYDTEKDIKLGILPDEKSHVPLLEVKKEEHVKFPINIKAEKEDWEDKDQYENSSFSILRRSSSDSINDEEDYNIADRSDDPLYGAFASASTF